MCLAPVRSSCMEYVSGDSNEFVVKQPRLQPVNSALWDEHIRAHDHRVLVSVLALGLPPDLAREVVQAAWTRLMERHASGELSALELPGLAIRQARFLAIDRLRRARTERRVLGKVVELAPQADSYEDLERRVVSRQRLERVVTALAGCPPTAQKLFRLVYSEKPMTHAQAAAEVGLSVQRVRQILCETRQAIRSRTEQEGS